jgi:predicted transcriptional regulator
MARSGEEIRHLPALFPTTVSSNEVSRMPRPASRQPTEVELQILRVLWQLGSATARQIHNGLLGTKPRNYSTTVKMLSLMRHKGLVSRDEDVRPHVYRAAMTRQNTQRQMLGHLIHQVYDGSAKSLVLEALSSHPPTQEDLVEIRKLIRELEGEQP